MQSRSVDGSAGDADDAAIGSGYAHYRQPEPRIAGFIHSALGGARSVRNVGAGAGSYEPTDRQVTAVEPSASMRAQRPAHLARAIDAVAAALPFPDKHVDASMATFTVHPWPDPEAGLAEMRRVTRGPLLVLSCDPDELDRFWLVDYASTAVVPGVAQAPGHALIASRSSGHPAREFRPARRRTRFRRSDTGFIPPIPGSVAGTVRATPFLA